MPPIEHIRGGVDRLDSKLPWSGSTHVGLLLLGFILTVVLGLSIPLDTSEKVLTGILGVALLNAVLRKVPSWEGLRHLLAITVLFYCVHYTDGLRDYYRYWGGNLRRAGDLPAATKAYEKVVEVAPDYASGRRHLGDLYRRQNRLEESIEQYLAGIDLEPDHFKLNKGAALSYDRLGKGPEALRRAKLALLKKPTDSDCLRIKARWQDKVD